MSTMRGQGAAAMAGVERTIAVSWSIDREAVRRARPDLDLPATRRAADAVLSITVAGRSCSAELRDDASDQVHPIELQGVRIDAIDADGFTHVDAYEGHESLLSATLREDSEGETKLLYARTALLARLGVQGGRYARPALDR
ncbi:MAG: hypothetical protein AAFR96_03830 [Planctomycetota bacterium]